MKKGILLVASFDERKRCSEKIGLLRFFKRKKYGLMREKNYKENEVNNLIEILDMIFKHEIVKKVKFFEGK